MPARSRKPSASKTPARPTPSLVDSLEVARGCTFGRTGSVTAKGTAPIFAADSATHVGGEGGAEFVTSGQGAWRTLFGGPDSLDALSSHHVAVDGVGPVRWP